MTMTNAERRKLFRIEVETPIRFRMIDDKSLKPLTDWISGSTADVSLGGMKVVAPMPESQAEMLVDQYMLIEISCRLPGAKEAFTATATIAYFERGAAKQKSAKVTFGLSFVTVDAGAKDIIGEFIRQSIDAISLLNAERRRLFRIEVASPVRFRMIEDKNSKPLTDWINGALADVSLGGVKISAPMSEDQIDMLVDQYMLIEFSGQLPDAKCAIAGTAEIAYFQRGPAKKKAATVTFGLSFVSIDANAKDALGEFIRQHLDDDGAEKIDRP